MSLFKSITLLALALPMAACTQTIVEEAAPEAQKGASYSSPGKGGAAVAIFPRNEGLPCCWRIYNRGNQCRR